MSERGKIKYPLSAGQLRDFSGLQYGRITPTDVDALIEYQDKAYILIELKTSGVKLEYGQRLRLKECAMIGCELVKFCLSRTQHATRAKHRRLQYNRCRISIQRNYVKLATTVQLKASLTDFLEYVNRTL